MREVERVARTLIRATAPGYSDAEIEAVWSLEKTTWRRAARYHLRELRRARGKTLGYVVVGKPDRGGDVHFRLPFTVTLKDAQGVAAEEKKRPFVARVVLVRRGKKGRSK